MIFARGPIQRTEAILELKDSDDELQSLDSFCLITMILKIAGITLSNHQQHRPPPVDISEETFGIHQQLIIRYSALTSNSYFGIRYQAPTHISVFGTHHQLIFWYSVVISNSYFGHIQGHLEAH